MLLASNFVSRSGVCEFFDDEQDSPDVTTKGSQWGTNRASDA